MTEPAVGIHAHPTKKLGRRPEDTSRPKLAFGQFLKTVPAAPLVDAQPGLAFPMDHNDQVGDCVVAAGDHALQIIGALLTGGYTNWTDEFMLKAYQTQNPAFTAWTDGGGPNDNGMDISTFLSWLVEQKLILGYAKIDTTKPAETTAAIFLGLAIITGEDMTVAQQSGDLWDYVAGAAAWGGHATTWGGYGDQELTQVVSWGSGAYEMSAAFVQHQVTEAYFIITQAHIDHPGFRDGFDLAAYAAAYQEITGAPFPVPVAPDPAPTPAPTPAPAPSAPTITSPVDGATLTSNTLSIAGTTAADGSVVIYDAATTLATVSATSGAFQASESLADGVHALRATLTTADGTSTDSAGVTVIVQAAPVPDPPTPTPAPPVPTPVPPTPPTPPTPAPTPDPVPIDEVLAVVAHKYLESRFDSWKLRHELREALALWLDTTGL